MNRKSFRFIWMIVILAGSMLACSLFSQVTSRAGEVKGTAQAVATNVGEGANLLATAQAVLTQDGSQLLSTAAAFATQQGPQFLETARAYATQEGPGMIETLQALATDKGPEVKATIQAFATDQGPEVAATALGLATQIAAETPIVPEDIPVVEGEVRNLTALLGTVSYRTSVPYNDVLTFYLAEMPANGWELVSDGTYQIPSTAVLKYQKVDRKVTVTLGMADQQTFVLILVQAR